MSATSNFTMTASIKKIKDLNVQQKLVLASMVILEPSLGQKQNFDKVYFCGTSLRFNFQHLKTSPIALGWIHENLPFQ